MFNLEPIPDVKPEWETTYRIRALAKDGESTVLDELVDRKEKNFDEYKKILNSIKIAVSSGRSLELMGNRIKPSKQHKGVFELRPGHGQIRLFFFRHPETHDIIICTNVYWKAKDSIKIQNQEFEKCNEIRTAYLTWLAQTEAPGREQP